MPQPSSAIPSSVDPDSFNSESQTLSLPSPASSSSPASPFSLEAFIDRAISDNSSSPDSPPVQARFSPSSVLSPSDSSNPPVSLSMNPSTSASSSRTPLSEFTPDGRRRSPYERFARYQDHSSATTPSTPESTVPVLPPSTKPLGQQAPLSPQPPQQNAQPVSNSNDSSSASAPSPPRKEGSRMGLKKLFGLGSSNSGSSAKASSPSQAPSQEPPLVAFPTVPSQLDFQQPPPLPEHSRPTRPSRPESFHLLNGEELGAPLQKVGSKASLLARYGPEAAVTDPVKRYHSPHSSSSSTTQRFITPGATPVTSHTNLPTQIPPDSHTLLEQQDRPSSPDFFQKTTESTDGHSDLAHDISPPDSSAPPTMLISEACDSNSNMESVPSPIPSPMRLPPGLPQSPDVNLRYQDNTSSIPPPVQKSNNADNNHGNIATNHKEPQQTLAPIKTDNTVSPNEQSLKISPSPSPALSATSSNNSLSSSTSLKRSPTSGYSPLAAFLGNKKSPSPGGSPSLSGTSNPSSSAFGTPEYFKQREEENAKRRIAEEEEKRKKQEEAERIRKEEAEKAAREQREEEERLAREKEERELRAREREERERKIREERERQETHERDLRMKKAEEARKAREEEEKRLLYEKMEREKEREEKAAANSEAQQYNAPGKHSQGEKESPSRARTTERVLPTTPKEHSQSHKLPQSGTPHTRSQQPTPPDSRPSTAERSLPRTKSNGSMATSQSHGSFQEKSKNIASTLRENAAPSQPTPDSSSVRSSHSNYSEFPSDRAKSDSDTVHSAHGRNGENLDNIDEGEQKQDSDYGDEDDDEDDDVGKPRLEYALIQFPEILRRMLVYLDYKSFRALRELSPSLRSTLSSKSTTEMVLERYLSDFGYEPSRRITPSNSTQGISAKVTKSTRGLDTTSAPKPLILRDLEAFMTAIELTLSEYVDLSREYRSRGLDNVTVRMLRACTRAWSKVVVHIRYQQESKARNSRDIPMPLLKNGRAPVLRVWVPTKTNWMADEEVVECERELWRAGVWTNLKRGDVVHNVACGDFANEGRLIFDSRYLRDLSYAYDSVGHLPSWLNSFTFSPSYFHNVVASSTPDPVMYLDLSPFASQVQQTLSLCQEAVDIEQAQGKYRVTTYKYRASVKVTPGTIIGSSGGGGGAGPGGVDVIHEDWQGRFILQTEGTAENARDLLSQCGLDPDRKQTPKYYTQPKSKSQLHAWRVIRARSRPGKVWLRTLNDDERVV